MTGDNEQDGRLPEGVADKLNRSERSPQMIIPGLEFHLKSKVSYPL